MRRQYATIGLLALLLAAPASIAWADEGDSAADLFTQGQNLLKEGDFTLALEAYANAARQAPDNTQYRQQFAILRRVIKVREKLELESNTEKWQSYAGALRSYYYAHDLFNEALKLDHKRHEKFNTADTAAMVGETLIHLDRNGEAIEVLQSIAPEDATLQSKVLTGIAFAHEGQTDEARKLAENTGALKDIGPGMLFDVACLKALIGDADGACSVLVKCFESTPPSRLDAFKDYAKDHADFASIANTDGFTEALKTESKVKESGCSGGTSCGNCPNRSKGCGSSDSDKKDCGSKK